MPLKRRAASVVGSGWPLVMEEDPITHFKLIIDRLYCPKLHLSAESMTPPEEMTNTAKSMIKPMQNLPKFSVVPQEGPFLSLSLFRIMLK